MPVQHLQLDDRPCVRALHGCCCTGMHALLVQCIALLQCCCCCLRAACALQAANSPLASCASRTPSRAAVAGPSRALPGRAARLLLAPRSDTNCWLCPGEHSLMALPLLVFSLKHAHRRKTTQNKYRLNSAASSLYLIFNWLHGLYNTHSRSSLTTT